MRLPRDLSGEEVARLLGRHCNRLMPGPLDCGVAGESERHTSTARTPNGGEATNGKLVRST